MSDNAAAPDPDFYKSYESYKSYDGNAPAGYGKCSHVQSEQPKQTVREKGSRGVFVWLSETDYHALMDFAPEDAPGTAARKALRQFLAMRKETKGKQ